MSLDHLPHLFVEGKTDKYVILQLLKNLGVFAQDGYGKLPANSKAVQIVVSEVKPTEGSSGSKEELLADLSQRIRKPIHAAIGYVFDADDPAFTGWRLQQTWQAIRDRLGKAPTLLVAPDPIPDEGFHGRHSKTGTPIGVWLMPDNIGTAFQKNCLLKDKSLDQRFVSWVQTLITGAPVP
jgi:uncharacterized protein DUF3226